MVKVKALQRVYRKDERKEYPAGATLEVSEAELLALEKIRKVERIKAEPKAEHRAKADDKYKRRDLRAED